MAFRVNPRPDRLDIVRVRKGCLEVRAVHDSQAGLSDLFVPEGTVGYVLSAHQPGFYLILWPTLLEAVGRRCVTGSHARDDVAPTGRRG